MPQDLSLHGASSSSAAKVPAAAEDSKRAVKQVLLRVMDGKGGALFVILDRGFR